MYAPYGWFDPYASLNLTETSPPQSFAEVLSLAEIKSWLKIPLRSPVDTAEDADLTDLIIAAREQAELAQKRDLVQKQWDASLDYWPCYRIRLGAPLVSVDLVRYRDSTGAYTTLVEDTDYVVDLSKRPGEIQPVYNKIWPLYTPWPSSSLLIRFTSGFSANAAWWSDSGSSVKTGMRALISEWYNNRLPFETGAKALSAYPLGIQVCLGAGSIPIIG